jgi:hypothetical protein
MVIPNKSTDGGPLEDAVKSSPSLVGGFAWPHGAAIAMSLVGMRWIVVRLRRQPRTHWHHALHQFSGEVSPGRHRSAGSTQLANGHWECGGSVTGLGAFTQPATPPILFDTHHFVAARVVGCKPDDDATAEIHGHTEERP